MPFSILWIHGALCLVQIALILWDTDLVMQHTRQLERSTPMPKKSPKPQGPQPSYKIKLLEWQSAQAYVGPWHAKTRFGDVRIVKIQPQVDEAACYSIISGRKEWNLLNRDHGPFHSVESAKSAVQQAFEDEVKAMLEEVA